MFHYLGQIKDWGLTYWRQEPCMELPEGKHTGRTTITYSAKWQITVATSSTEAEFVQAISAAKMAKYLRTVLNELGITQHSPTMIYKDNIAAIMVANANKPNGCNWHIDISYFALQEWVQERKVKLAQIRGVSNLADALTKALGWTLHRRHAMQMMRLVGTVYTCTSGRI
eukprot:10536368-Ditylum_brightwellii.AAC.1